MEIWQSAYRTGLIAVVLVSIIACSGAPKNPMEADVCENGLAQAYQELDFAKTQGFDGSVDYTKASSLLTAAKVQQQFGKYPNCIDKVERARYYIKQSQT